MSNVTSIIDKTVHIAPTKPANEDSARPVGALNWPHLNSGAPIGTYDQAPHHGHLPHPDDVDPNTIRGSVLTKDGWLCSEPHHTKHISNEAHLVAVTEKK